MTAAPEPAALHRALVAADLYGEPDPAALADVLRGLGRLDPALASACAAVVCGRAVVRRAGGDPGAETRVALAPPARVTARRADDGWVLDGRVPAALVAAEVHLVAAATGEGWTLFRLPASAAPPGSATEDGRAALALDAVVLPDAARVGPVDGAGALLADARRHERVLALAPWHGAWDAALERLAAALRAREVDGHPLAKRATARATFAELHARHAIGLRLHARAVASLDGRGDTPADAELAALHGLRTLETLLPAVARLTGDALDRRLAATAALAALRLDPAGRLPALVAATLAPEAPCTTR